MCAVSFLAGRSRLSSLITSLKVIFYAANVLDKAAGIALYEPPEGHAPPTKSPTYRMNRNVAHGVYALAIGNLCT